MKRLNWNFQEPFGLRTTFRMTDSEDTILNVASIQMFDMIYDKAGNVVMESFVHASSIF